MREIKFRAWQKHFKIMDNSPSVSRDITFINTQFDNPDEIYMQYTGLKDKNGKDIFKGDICKTYSVDYGKEITNVVFLSGSFCFENHGYELSNYKQHYIEIIGNIHEDNLDSFK